MRLAKRPMVIDRRQLPVRTRLVLSMVLFNAWNIVETADVCHRPLFREFSGIGRCKSCPERYWVVELRPGTRLPEWGAIRSITLGDAHGLIGDDDHPRVGFRCLRILAPLETSRRSWLILTMAEAAGCVPVNFEEVDVRSQLVELSGGRGPDKCIDAVWKPCTAAATDLPEMRADEVARHQH